jgi:hypothetical protein
MFIVILLLSTVHTQHTRNLVLAPALCPIGFTSWRAASCRSYRSMMPPAVRAIPEPVTALENHPASRAVRLRETLEEHFSRGLTNFIS